MNETSVPRLFKLAILGGVNRAVEAHLARGISANVQDEHGRSPLMIAAAQGHAATCRLLLDAGASPTLRDHAGNDAISIARREGLKDVLAILEDALPSRTCSTAAVVEMATGAGEKDDPPPDGDWVEDTDSPPPPEDIARVVAQSEIHAVISAHKPIDQDASWYDVPLEDLLPGHGRWVRNLDDKPELLTAIEDTFRSAIGSGWIPRKDMSVLSEGALDPDAEDILSAQMEVVLADLGVYVVETDGYADGLPSDEGDDDRIDSALAFLRDLASGDSDVINLYLKEAIRFPLLNRQTEAELFRQASDALVQVIDVLVRSPDVLRSLVANAETARPAPSPDVVDHKAPPTALTADETEEVQGPLDDEDDPDEPETDIHRKTAGSWADGIWSDPKKSAALEALASLCGGSAGRQTATAPLIVGLLRLLAPPWEVLVAIGGTDAGACSEYNRAVGCVRAIYSEIVKANLRLVVTVARRYVNRGLDLADLIQEGNLGLMKAVTKFEIGRGNKLSTYAMWWIRQSITHGLANKARAIRIPVHRLETVNKIGKTTQLFLQEHGRPPTPEELGTRLEIASTEIIKAMRVDREIVLLGDGEGGSVNEEDLIDYNAENPLDRAIHSNLGAVLDEMLAELPERDQRVLELRFGLHGHANHTLEEVGQVLSVTRERIRQIELKALAKLGHPKRIARLRGWYSQ